MTDLTPSPSWSPIRQIETTDRVLGGEGGVANLQAQALLNQATLIRLFAGLPFDSDFTNSVGGFPIGGRVCLASGVLVMSEVDGNLRDPNSDMTGWVLDDATRGLNGLTYAPDLPANRHLRVVAGSFRNTGDGWKWISDSAHTPVGVTPTIEVVGLAIKINYGFTAKRVVALTATPDETLAGLGMTSGGSVGTSFTNFSLFAPLSFAVDIGTGVITAPAYRGLNISASVVNNALVVTHPKVDDGFAVSMQKLGATTPVHSDVVMSSGTTQLTIYGGGNIDGKLTMNGTTWGYSGELRTIPTVTFEAGELTVTHSECDLNSIDIVPMVGGLRAILSDVTNTSFKVKFLDAANVIQTTVPSGTAFIFSRKANVPKNRRKGMFSVQRGYAAVAANDLISSTGNIWVMGVMEV